ncbi:hypothetical protein [Geothrix sp. PMB-07]|uniref:hypothetical protein n=1 Tax=Geothrix sp. PMB-07 TaxID=3068640 RepID=UPI0027418213|nr:hypothetical protein [Geothrix sp. PMB-07]WLT33014.1 hypothetical protein Q9293_06715 [Geothrix sp. PMB-07]
MTPEQRLEGYFPQALAILGIPADPRAWTDFGETQARAFAALELPRRHARQDAAQDAGEPPRLERDEAAKVARLARDLREALQDAGPDLQRSIAGLWEGRTGGREGASLALWAEAAPALPAALMGGLEALEGIARDRAEHLRGSIARQHKPETPDAALVREALALAKRCGVSQEKGLQLARLAFEASTGKAPKGEDWGRSAKRRQSVK